MTYSMDQIGNDLRAAREQLGMTQREFATRAGTNQARVSTIENGEVDVRVSTLVEFVRNLDLELMLIPRKHLPAVKALLSLEAQTASDRKTLRELAKLSNVVIPLIERAPNNRDFVAIAQLANELRSLRLKPDHALQIETIAADLKNNQSGPGLEAIARAQVFKLKSIRNALLHAAHSDMDGPRPAYRLDEIEDG